LDRHGGRLLDWELGDRTAETFQKLFDRLKEFKVLFSCADHWKGFGKAIPSHQLFQGKDKTLNIERNNSRQRHWFARFRRRSLVVSKTLEMVHITLQILAAVHVNRTLTPIFLFLTMILTQIYRIVKTLINECLTIRMSS
jgi:insertion element IS1 protein InsB